jgi:hypothetical protein
MAYSWQMLQRHCIQCLCGNRCLELTASLKCPAILHDLISNHDNRSTVVTHASCVDFSCVAGVAKSLGSVATLLVNIANAGFAKYLQTRFAASQCSVVGATV